MKRHPFFIILVIFLSVLSGCHYEEDSSCLICSKSWETYTDRAIAGLNISGNGSLIITSVEAPYFYLLSKELKLNVSALPSGSGVNKTYVDTQDSTIRTNLTNNFLTKTVYWSNLTSKLTQYLKISDWVTNVSGYLTKTQDYNNDTLSWQKRTDWTTHDNYPVACSGLTNTVQGIGDTLTCINPDKNPKHWINYTTSAYTTTNNTRYTKLSNLKAELEASSTYIRRCDFLTYSAAATTGEQLRVNTTGSPTKVTWSFCSQVSATTQTCFQGVSTSSNAFADTGSAGTNIRDNTRLRGYIVTSASASTIQFETKSEVASSSETYDIGSYCEYIKVQ